MSVDCDARPGEPRVRMRERHKRPGVCYAMTDDGLELPVVDVTHEAFSHHPSAADFDAIADATFRAFARWERMPAPVRWILSRNSLTLRQLAQAKGSFVSGTATYLFKLGPENLGRYASRVDRHLNAALTPVAVRLRLRSVARLLADALAAPLAARRGPLWLANIGGGTGIDSLNALIVLAKEHPDLLRGRPITVMVLDCDVAGPRFGTRALAALTSAAGPLHDLEARFNRIQYDWSNVDALSDMLAAIDASAVFACSSEGGLFEYGRDQDIVSNLRVLHGAGPADAVVVGSLLMDGPIPARIRANGRMPSWRQFPLDKFDCLITATGWRRSGVTSDNPLYHTFTLKK